jgi:hypothetical protein
MKNIKHKIHNAIRYTLYAILILFLPQAAQAGEQIIIDHTSVDLYDKIPEYYMNEAKKMWLNIPGESHSSGYRKGITFLSQQNPAYAAVVTESGSPEPYREDALRISRLVRGPSNNWSTAYGGEEDWYANPAALTIIPNHLDYCNTHNLEIAATGFGWCWDMTWHNAPGGGIDPVYNTRWAGSSVDGPEGDLRWGLDEEDYALTGNSVNMKTYLNATQAYADYAVSKGYKTKVLFTTGPVDGNANNENGFQRYLKHEYIRNFVRQDPSRALFDYADILCYNNSGQLYTAIWTRGSEFGAYTGTRETIPSIHPDNMKDFSGSYAEDGDHIGEVGALRLGKALWVLAARLAGWQPGVVYGDVSENGAISATDASMAARYAVGLDSLTASQITAADVTGNGSVSSTDASWIARRAVDETIVFPVEEG